MGREFHSVLGDIVVARRAQTGQVGPDIRPSPRPWNNVVRLHRLIRTALEALPRLFLERLKATALVENMHQLIPGLVIIRLGDAGDLGVTVHRPPRAPVKPIRLHGEDLAPDNALGSAPGHCTFAG